VQTDYLQYIFQAINTLLTQKPRLLRHHGARISFVSFATILIAWYGIKSALSAASGRSPFHFDNFASLLLTISFGFAMVNYYNAPIPGVGVSFHNLVTNEAQFLSGQIDQAQLQTVGRSSCGLRVPYGLSDVGRHFRNCHIRHRDHSARRGPGRGDCGHRLWIHRHCGCVLVGAGLCPFFIVPKMEWLFWGWFRCFIQYALSTRSSPAAVVFIIGNLMLGALRLPPAGTLSTVQLIAWFPVLFITFLASIYALLKVPALTNHIFSGTAGGSSVGIIERVFE